MGGMRLSITRAEHDASISSAIVDATGTNAPAGDCDHAADAAAITSIRGGQPATAVAPSKGTASGAAVAKLAAEAKNPKPTADPLKVVVVNPDYDESHWVTYKAHCRPMRKVVDDFKATNPLPSAPTTHP